MKRKNETRRSTTTRRAVRATSNDAPRRATPAPMTPTTRTGYTVSRVPKRNALPPRPAEVATLLMKSGPLAAPTIAERVGVTLNAIAGALHVLRMRGLLRTTSLA